MLLRSLLLLLVCASSALAQQTATPDEVARFLAGLPVRGTPLDEQSRTAAWAEHATSFDKAWQQLESRQLGKIRTWGPEFLGPQYASREPVFYFFSGPDILYANAFYPNAGTYVLAGLEPVGTPPDVANLPPGILAAALANLRKSLNSVLSFSFFITKDMKVDLRQQQLSGTLPVLYVFLARAGCKIESVELVTLDKTGALVPTKGGTPGARIVFTGAGGQQQMMYYFMSDLSNEGVRTQPGFTKFCAQLGQGRSLVKAASYLMHMSAFTNARDFLLAHCDAIVQDDSGIPLKDLPSGTWAVRFFGSYPGPIDLFKQHAQPDLAAAYARSNPPGLPFGFGYQWQPTRSSLMLISRRGSSTPPVAPIAPAAPSTNPPNP